MLGAAAPVRCYHHQAIRRLGGGLRPVAWAPDDTVEAIELPDRRFAVGVQWHPEEDTEDLRVFAALVAAALEQPDGPRGTGPATGERGREETGEPMVGSGGSMSGVGPIGG